MFSISLDFRNKIAREGGILDTTRYRYVLGDDPRGEVQRLPVADLDTTAAAGGWEFGRVRREK